MKPQRSAGRKRMRAWAIFNERGVLMEDADAVAVYRDRKDALSSAGADETVRPCFVSWSTPKAKKVRKRR